MIHFTPLFRDKQAIKFIDDTVMQLQTEPETFENIDEYHHLPIKSSLKAQTEKKRTAS